MSFERTPLDKTYRPLVRGWESMLELIKAFGIIPFFENPIAGFSVEEHTPGQFWFTDECLGPWDWKIECVQSGEIAYGKFLWGGKAAFATVEIYRELMNYRRSLSKCAAGAQRQADGSKNLSVGRSLHRSSHDFGPQQQAVMEYVHEHGSITIPEVRKLLDVKKSAADSLIAGLQWQTRLVTGDIKRVYHGEDLHYSGWQRASFCTPEGLFDDDDFRSFFAAQPAATVGANSSSFASSLTPAESLLFVKDCIRSHCGDIPENIFKRLLG